jgi:hypothetical protein
MIALLTFAGFVAAGVAVCFTATEIASTARLPRRIGFRVD